jgi:hypothetical protein
MLCAGEIDGTWLAALRARWRMAAVDDPRLVGTARLRRAADLFVWERRRIGPGSLGAST